MARTTTSHILSAIFRQLKSRPGFDAVGIEQYRKLLEKSALAFKPDTSMEIMPFHIDAIEAEWIRPAKHDSSRIIMYVHGGGYIAGSTVSHRDLASRIAGASHTRVLIFNYGLAPEHPFPEGLLDVKRVYQWLTDTYGDTHNISLVGDSAGAGLALSLLSELLRETLPLPACTALISPWADLECKNNSHIENQEKDPMLSQETLKKTARYYTDKDLSTPLVSPINCDFTGSPPLLIQTGGHEVLVDDSKILAKKLEAAGVTVQLEIWEGMFHVWHYFARYLPEGRQAIGHIADFIKAHS